MKKLFFGPFAAIFLFSAQAVAHGGGDGGSHTGIPVPAISHGEMAVIANYYGRIIDVASNASVTNEPFRRVLNYAQIEYSYCLWGQVPGSITDETSPFNKCAHAYLAAAKAVLLATRELPHGAQAASAITSEIDAEMVRKGLALITCRFSAETFNTSDIVYPGWSDVPTHPASAATFLGLFALLVSLLVAGSRLLPTEAKRYPKS